MLTKARAELSPQQLTIMQLSWDGLTIKETAMQMGLSDRTVKNYRNNIYEKLGVSNVAGMLRQGVERGFLTISSRIQEWP
jgi:DNA-binding NarL/FixJ family response regulator